jgi:trehalose synthase
MITTAALTHVPVGPIPLDRFRAVLGDAQWAELEETRLRSAEELAGRVVWNLNSTAHGGGVAEMLWSLIAYARGSGVDARWVVIGGNPPFYELTKRLHNRLHGYPGDGGPLGAAEHAIYEDTLRAAADELHTLAGPRDIVVLHDPQTAGLVSALHGIPVVWRSHIGCDMPGPLAQEAWEFLLRYIEPAAGWVFSRSEYVPKQLDPERVTIVPPSIDAFSPKNQEIDPLVAAAILAAAGLMDGSAGDTAPAFTRQDGTPGRVDRRADIGDTALAPAGASLVTQVSRWDTLKDPLGVLHGFLDHVAPRRPEAHLVLAGPAVAGVSDDPEGAEVLAQVRAAWSRLPEALRARVCVACLPMEDAEENAAIVNALQRSSAVMVQKSLAEGFGLTVAEAMWKSRPVVASAVGGIRDQIEDGVSGVLLPDPTDLERYGTAVADLLADPTRAATLGAAAHERVREHSLSGRHLIQYVQLLERLAP